MGVLINVGSIIGKEILNLEDGAMLGKVYGVTMTPDCKVAGIKVRERKFMGSINLVPFENVKAFGATITVNAAATPAGPESREIIGRTVIGVDGDTFGQVEELAFDSETGELSEIVVKGDLMDTVLNGHGILDGSKVVSIGKDVVIVAAGITPADFAAPGEEFYGDWKKMDEVLEEIDGAGKETTGEATASSDEVSFDEESFDATTEAEKIGSALEDTIEAFAKTMEEALGRFRKEFTGERVRKQTDSFIDRFSDEAKNVFHSVQDMVKDVENSDFGETLKNRMSRKDEPEEVLAADLVEQLKDLTVEKPVLDEDDNVIVWPGQMIGKAEIKAALRAGVLQDLLDFATVSLKSEEEQSAEADAAEVAEEPEIEVEVFVDEDYYDEVMDPEEAAFIAEEAAKMEQAEEAPEEAEDDDATACICDLEETVENIVDVAAEVVEAAAETATEVVEAIVDAVDDAVAEIFADEDEKEEKDAE